MEYFGRHLSKNLLATRILIRYENFYPMKAGGWLMVIPSFDHHDNSVLGARISGLSRALQQLSNSRCPSFFVATHDSHARSLAKYLFFVALGEAYHDHAPCSFAVQTYYPKSKRALCSPMCIGNGFNWKYFRIVAPIRNLVFAKYLHAKIK